MYLILVVLAIVFAYTIRRKSILEKQVNLFKRLLYIEKNPEKYIAEVDNLLMRMQSEKEKNINLIQKTTGLFYSGEFSEAIDILTEQVTKIPPNWQVIYYHNLLLSMYFNGSIEKANEVLDDVRATIDKYYSRDYNKVTIELIYAVSDFYNGNISKCREFFNNLIEAAGNDYRISIGYYFKSKILEMQNKLEDAEDSMEEARNYGHGSFIEKL